MKKEYKTPEWIEILKKIIEENQKEKFDISNP
jgi:hypothetical protein